MGYRAPRFSRKEKRPKNRKSFPDSRHAHEIGLYRERLVMRALHKKPLPSWIKSYARCGLSEDLEGKDLRIETDLGDVFIQIKSSEEGRRKFLKSGSHNFLVEVVVIKDDFSPEWILDLIVSAATRLRKQLMRQSVRLRTA